MVLGQLLQSACTSFTTSFLIADNEVWMKGRIVNNERRREDSMSGCGY